MVNMPYTFTELSKMKDRGPELAVSHELWIDGVNHSEDLISATVTYSTDAGGSGMDFDMWGSLDDYQDAPVELHLGYGPWKVPYFKGRIQAPKDNEIINTASATAFGPFRLMVEQVLGSNETFIGRTLEWVIMECANRAGYGTGQIVVVNGRTYRVKPGEAFPFDNKLSDVVTSLMSKAEFIGVDQPGGRRLFMPKPIPGSNTDFKTTYTSDDYMTASMDKSNETSYHKVVVYRNGDNGKPVVYAERKIDSQALYQPPRNRWFVVSDFIGNQREAGDEAYRLAMSLRNVERNFSMSTLFNPDLHLYDGFKLVKIKNDKQKVYAASITSGITVNYAPGTPAIMELTGSAYEIKRERQEIKKAPKRYAVSPGLLRRNAPVSDNLLVDDLIITDDSALG